jgi:hypothetical protein
MCDYASRTTMHRLVHNELAPAYRKKLIKLLGTKSADISSQKRSSRAEIDQELIPILNGDYQPMISQRIELHPTNAAGSALRTAKAVPSIHLPTRRGHATRFSFRRRCSTSSIALSTPSDTRALSQVTGDIGSGKSTLRALIEDHVAENENLAHRLARVFRHEDGVADADRSADPRFVRCSLSWLGVRRGKAVRDLLARLYSDGTRVAIAFDEIHRPTTQLCRRSRISSRCRAAVFSDTSA